MELVGNKKLTRWNSPRIWKLQPKGFQCLLEPVSGLLLWAGRCFVLDGKGI